MTSLDSLRDQLQRTWNGDAWYGPPLRPLLDDVTSTQAAAKPLPNAHSIWELVLHITAWEGEVDRRLAARDAREPDEGDWPGLPLQGSEVSWKSALERMDLVHAKLTQSIAKLVESDLNERIGKVREPATGSGATIEQLLHGVIQHNIYHAGQIAILKKASAVT